MSNRSWSQPKVTLMFLSAAPRPLPEPIDIVRNSTNPMVVMCYEPLEYGLALGRSRPSIRLAFDTRRLSEAATTSLMNGNFLKVFIGPVSLCCAVRTVRAAPSGEAGVPGRTPSSRRRRNSSCSSSDASAIRRKPSVDTKSRLKFVFRVACARVKRYEWQKRGIG